MLHNDEILENLKSEQYEIPPSIDLCKILMEKEYYKEIKHIPYYTYFLHLIYSKQGNTNDFVSLSSKLINQKITYRPVSNRIKKNLVELNIIEIDPRYIPRVKCKGYRITSTYLNSEYDKNLTTYIRNKIDGIQMVIQMVIYSICG